MATILWRRSWAPIVFAVVLGLSGCSNKSGAPGAPPAQAGITGAGATFPAPLYQRWFSEYASSTGVSVNYQPIGSGGGIKNITAKSVDFGASDAPMSDAEMAKAPAIVHIPTVAGAVCVAYNIPGLQGSLKLDGATIAGIFSGKITRWNDPAITALNPGLSLPAAPVLPVHRSDSSGTTNIFTNYLAAVNPAWKASVGAGKSVNWLKGLGGKGTAGVAALVQQNPGGVGYVELNYAVANKLSYASVRNQAGRFIAPSVDSTTAAASGVTLPPDFRDVIVNTTAPDGYPITGFTFILVYSDCRPDVKKLLEWCLTTGQKDAPGMYYAPLPDNVKKEALAKVDSLT